MSIDADARCLESCRFNFKSDVGSAGTNKIKQLNIYFHIREQKAHSLKFQSEIDLGSMKIGVIGLDLGSLGVEGLSEPKEGDLQDPQGFGKTAICCLLVILVDEAGACIVCVSKLFRNFLGAADE
jgi:hypothetical protein